MEIIEITKQNTGFMKGFIDEDMLENIGRIFYRGLAVVDEDEIRCAMIWEVLNLENSRSNESRICFFKARDEEAASGILDAYDMKVMAEDIRVSSVVMPVENRRAEKEILKRAGFSVMLTESDQIILSLSELLELSIMKSKAIPDNILTLRDISVGQFRNGISKCLKNGKKGLCEDLSYLDISFFENDVSCCNETDGDIDSFLLFHVLPSGMLSIQFMISMNPDARNVLLGMMRQFVLNMDQEYTRDTKVLLNRHNQASLLLSEKLFPRNIGIPVYSGSRQE